MADRLREAAAEGRLLTVELEQRLGAAFSARTYGELDALVGDLPSGRRLERRRSSTVAPWVRPAAALAVAVPLTVVVVAVAAFVLAGVLATWMVWAAIAWFVFGHRRYHRGRFSGPRRGLEPNRRSWTA